MLISQRSPHTPRDLARVCHPLYAARIVLVLAALLAGTEILAQPTSCDTAVEWKAISPDVARDAGLRNLGGRYVLDADALARRAGGPEALLDASDKQLRTNMKWFDAIEGVYNQRSTPNLPDIEAVYQQALETHEVELGIRRAVQCLLGQSPSPPERPKTLATLQQERQARIARAEAEASRAQAGRDFLNTLSTVGRALGAAGAVAGAAAVPKRSSSSGHSNELAEGRSSR